MAHAGLSACVRGCVLDTSTNLTIASPSKPLDRQISSFKTNPLLQQSTNPTIASLRHGGGIAKRIG